MSRQRRSSLSGSPVLVGAVTVIVTMVAVFLSYNANEGLPFVPTYDLSADVPTANGLVRGNEVRIGGARIGVVTSIATKPKDNGDVVADLTLSLDERVSPLPKDSTVIIRPRSALGLKYVEITRGKSEEGFAEGDVIPLTASKVQTQEIDDFFNMWDEPTRTGSSINLEEYGAAFAGRGSALNETFAELGPLARKLEPAMHNLASPETGFGRLWEAFEQAAAETAPVAGQHGALYGALDVTFTAWASVADSLQQTIELGPAALKSATDAFPAQRPFLAHNEELFRRFRPGFAAIADAAPGLAKAFKAGTPALQRSPALNRRLTKTLETLDKFGDDPRVPSGLRRITRTASIAKPLLAFVTPAQTVCNYGTLFFRNFSSATSESDSVGSFLRVGTLALPQMPGSEAGPSAVPANGPLPPPNVTVRERTIMQDSFLHSNMYPHTAAPGQPRTCEAGNEQYFRDRVVIGNPPGPNVTATETTKRKLR